MPRKPESIAVEVLEGSNSSETDKTHSLIRREREERCQEDNERISQYERKRKR